MSETSDLYPNDFIVLPKTLGSEHVDEQDEQDAQQLSLFKSIEEATNAAHFITDGKQFLYVNPAFEALTGYTREALLSIDPCDFFSQDHEGMGFECRAPLPSQFKTKIMTKGGEERWIALSTTPIEHMQGQALLGTLVDFTEYKLREEALKKSEVRYRAVLESAPDMIMIYGLDGTVIDINSVGAKILGVSREEAIGCHGPTEFWAEEDRARFPEILEETLRRGELFRDISGLHADGRAWFAESNAKVAKLGDETFIIVIVRDVTERKLLEEQLRSALNEKEMLLREIHHRVKNNMQIISTLLKLQLMNTKDERTKALFRESQNRILSMAMIHEKLYQSKGLHRIDLKDYVGDLASEAFASFGEGSERIKLKFGIEDVSFGMDTTIPCGLIIIELLSNSLKYAFPTGKTGEIFIGLRSKGGGRFELTVSDSGVGLPRGIRINHLKTLGLRLVSDLAKYQLDGEIDISSGDQGAAFRVIFQDREGSREGNA